MTEPSCVLQLATKLDNPEPPACWLCGKGIGRLFAIGWRPTWVCDVCQCILRRPDAV